jgi:flagellar hook assembly protein FlgD
MRATDIRHSLPLAHIGFAFRVPSEESVTAQLVDASGRVVRHLLDGVHPAGTYSLTWNGQDDDGRDLPAGVYLTRIMTVEGTTTGRVVLAK